MAHSVLPRAGRRNRGAGFQGSTGPDMPAGLVPRVAGAAWCALVLWLLVSNILVPSYGVFRYDIWAALAAGAAVLVLTAAVPWLLRGLDALLKFRWLRVLGSVLGWSAVFALLARCADAVRLVPDWDAAPVYFSASGLAEEDTLEAVNRSYFQINPNNLLLMLLLSRYLYAAESLGSQDLRQSTAYLNAALLFCGMVLTYAAGRLLGGRMAARLTLVPSLVLIVLSPWLPVFYSDTASLPFTAGVFCLLLLAGKCRLPFRLLLWATAGAVSAVGYGIKPTVLIILVAASLTALFSLRRQAWRRDLAAGLLSVAAAGGAFAGSYAATEEWERESGVLAEGVPKNEYSLPVTHFLKVGVQQYPGPHGDYYGAYNEEDRSTTLAVEDPRERFDAALRVYTDRVAARRALDYAGFLHAKLRWITGDGSFFSWGEGRLGAEGFIADDPLSRTVQDFYGPGRPGFPLLQNVWQGTWFLVLALCGAALFLRGPPLNSLGAVTARITLLGLFVFLMFSEGRARFLYLYLPLFLVLASLSLSRLLPAGRRGAGRRAAASKARHRDAPPPPTPAEVVE